MTVDTPDTNDVVTRVKEIARFAFLIFIYRQQNLRKPPRNQSRHRVPVSSLDSFLSNSLPSRTRLVHLFVSLVVPVGNEPSSIAYTNGFTLGRGLIPSVPSRPLSLYLGASSVFEPAVMSL